MMIPFQQGTTKGQRHGPPAAKASREPAHMAFNIYNGHVGHRPKCRDTGQSIGQIVSQRSVKVLPPVSPRCVPPFPTGLKPRSTGRRDGTKSHHFDHQDYNCHHHH